MKQFKTESKKLLDLMINSIYTNKEIFLRELISNASDAIDKLSFESLTNPDMKVDSDSLAITISLDRDARTITVSDNGIGMTKDELDKNLGTIAHSGSEQFKEANAEHQGDEMDIIGQFGVGFYSSFMVADRVRVVSRAFGADAAYAWESDGIKGYTVKPADAGERDGADDHGTDVIVHLRPSTDEEDLDRFLTEDGIEELVRHYSNYVRHPIKMMVTKTRQKPKPEDAGEDYKPEYETYQELETLNSMTPIWKKRKSEVSDEDYAEFYKSTFHDWEDPLRTISFHAEGALSYDALLFIPSQAPFDLYSKDYEKGLALYSSNVMIQEKCADLLPDYYNFVRGVVDSPDITLNISRETLQKNSQLRAIARRVERKVTDELRDMRDNDREAYEGFWKNFGRGIKFGIYNTYGTKADELGELLLFWSAKQGKMVTLKEYVDAMAEGQDKIYYIGGEAREILEKTPKVASALEHGYDVLLCTQDVDEFMFQFMRTYHVDAQEATDEAEAVEARDIPLVNVTSADLDLATDEEKEQAEKATTEHKELFDAMKKDLEGKVDDVRVAAGLGGSPATVASEGAMSLEMERVVAQGPEGSDIPRAKRVLQLNPDHPVFEKLVSAQEAGDDERLKLLSEVLYDQALLVEGLPIEDPAAFADNITKLM
jgi:molecular chaperone HtpG